MLKDVNRSSDFAAVGWSTTFPLTGSKPLDPARVYRPTILPRRGRPERHAQRPKSQTLAQGRPRERVRLGILLALRAQSQRRFCVWLWGNLRPLFPHLPVHASVNGQRTRARRFRLLAHHQSWAHPRGEPSSRSAKRARATGAGSLRPPEVASACLTAISRAPVERP